MRWSSQGMVSPRDGRAIFVHQYRDRKVPTLVVRTSGSIQALAYFKSEHEGKLFCELMGLEISYHSEPPVP